MSKTSAQIIEAIETFKAEDEKFANGNKAAGTRARKALMEIKKLADARRKEIQAEKNEA
ncbi:MAG: histone H1 [Proteobacteria bacterium]|nr:histone H1 [Pseudomonadota bacterium]